MKKKNLLEAVIEFLQVKRELASTELRKMDAEAEVVAANLRMNQLQRRRDELMEIIAAEALEILKKE